MDQKTEILLYDGLLFQPFKLLTLNDYPQGNLGDIHQHDCFQIIIVLQGSITMIDEARKKLMISPGEMGIIAPGKIHVWEIPNTACRTLQFTHEPLLLDSYGELSMIFGTQKPEWRKIKIDLKDVLRFEKLVRQEITGKRPGQSAMIHSYLMQILVTAMRAFAAEDTLPNSGYSVNSVKNALIYIENHYRETISLKQLASCSNLSVNRFSELFRQFTGTSPMNYLYQFRINKSKLLLLYSGMSISEVADYLGFSSVHYFSRSFKKYTDTSPSRFIAQQK